MMCFKKQTNKKTPNNNHQTGLGCMPERVACSHGLLAFLT